MKIIISGMWRSVVGKYLSLFLRKVWSPYTLMTEVAGSSETLIRIFQTTRCYIPENNKFLCDLRCEVLVSHGNIYEDYSPLGV
jgi:hypothetical protein